MEGGIEESNILKILENLSQVQRRIINAAHRAGRNPTDIKLVAVTKGVNEPAIQEVIAGGIHSLGENRVQEFLKKYSCLPPGIDWHFIGHLQTNKVKKIIDKVGLIHSLDRWSLAEAINKEAGAIERTARVLLQVNVTGEKTKQGISPAELEDFLGEAACLPGLKICGLMAMAPMSEYPEKVRPVFKKTRELFLRLKNCLPGGGMEYLSMGMTSDFEVAVEEGANIVRIGTAIFGLKPGVCEM